MNFEEISKIGYAWHKDTILANAKRNAPHIKNTIRECMPDNRPCVVVSAGPSLYRKSSLKTLRAYRHKVCVVAVDGSYIQCLRAGIVPDYVVTVDPHPTRIVRWFGDPQIEENLNGDDYFARQDLDEAFRTNQIEQNEKNIALVDANKTALVVGVAAGANVVARTQPFDRYWFTPLVDSPVSGSLTSQMVEATKAPALNTGGTVGTAAWAFAFVILESPNIAVVGMDMAYYADTPHERTQTYNLIGHEPMAYIAMSSPDGESFYTDPTYRWYCHNFNELLEWNRAVIYNCTEGGVLMGKNVRWMRLSEWLKNI